MSENKKRRLNSESEESNETKTEQKDVKIVETPKRETVSASQSSAGSDHKPVFGASSTFGKASIFENMKNGKNVFDSPLKDSKKESDPIPATPATSFGSFGGSFGANSKFSNAFQKASQKKSFLDEPELSNSKTSPSSTPAPPPQYKQVDLTVKEVKTGEENEQSIFSTTAKLFELNLTKISEGWKERGVGPLHLNRSNADPSQIRIVMRSHGLLRVILNYKITPTTKLIKGLDASLSPGKFLRVNSISADGTPLQYLIKFSDQTIRDGLCDKVESVQTDSKAHIAPVEEKGFVFKDPEPSPQYDDEPNTDVDSDENEAEDEDEDKTEKTTDDSKKEGDAAEVAVENGEKAEASLKKDQSDN